ncbi:JHBP domain containing protein [Asbolus verrucosus]|uniref:JHBP domain containing protein n=1 Tax=Asbolus verrucosus TaxID=1661398 RepID=A0A482W834_ASBVE|nr:JHBP domain containing protein [Asbolus verrucosus]
MFVSAANFHKCNRQQPDWKECAFNAAQHGLTQLNRAYDELNIPSLNPYEVKEVSVAAGSGRSFAVNQHYRNCKVYGLNNANVTTFQFDFEKKTMNLNGLFPEVSIACDYELDGKILVLPVQGKGRSEITFKNGWAAILLSFEEAKKKRRTYLKFTSNEFVMKPELVTFHYDNLFNGDKTLTDNTNKVLNENWEAVFEDSKDDFAGIVEKIFLELINNFFSNVSVEEAFE